MDADRFDTLSRHLGAADTRRSLLRLVGTLPLAGALATVRGVAEANVPVDEVRERAGRRHRRQDHAHRHDRRKGKRGGDHQNGDPTSSPLGCPAGTIKLANGSCAIVCGSCPNGCACQVFNAGPNLCTVFPPESSNQTCDSTADCDPGHVCYGLACQVLCPLPSV